MLFSYMRKVASYPFCFLDLSLVEQVADYSERINEAESSGRVMLAYLEDP